MAKGKKKGNKKEDIPISKLSISDSEPSTSQASEPSTSQASEPSTSQASELSETKEEEGLTGKGHRKKQKKATAPVEEPQNVVPTPTPVEVKPETNPEPVKEEVKEEDDDGLGLGLGTKKKRAPRKKKGDAAKTEAPGVQSKPAEAALTGAPPTSTGQGDMPMAQGSSGWGRAPPAGIAQQAQFSGVQQPFQSSAQGQMPPHAMPQQAYPGQPGFPVAQQPGQVPSGGWGQMPPHGMPQQVYPGQPGFPGAQQPGQVPSGGRGQMPPHGMPQQVYPAQPGFPGAQQPGQVPSGGRGQMPPHAMPQQVYPGQPGFPGAQQSGQVQSGGRGQIPPHAMPHQAYPGQPVFPGAQPPMAQGRGQIPPGMGRGGQPQQLPPSSTPSQPQVQSGAIQPVSHYKIPAKIPGNSVRMGVADVLTNYLPMTIKPLKIFRYDVSFTPDRPKKVIPLVFKQIRSKFFPKEYIAFDQFKNCYTLKALPKVPQNDRFTTEEQFTDDNGKVMKFSVSIKHTGIVDLGTILNYMKSGTSTNPPTEAIQAVDVILRQGTLDTYKKAGRQFFKRPANPILLGDGLEMWTGMFQSAIFTSMAFVNVDVAHKGFPIQQPLLQAIEKEFRLDSRRPLQDQRGFVLPFLEFIKGLRVVASNFGQGKEKREYICNGLVKPANVQTFSMTEKDGRAVTITVDKYFQQHKGYKIRYPHLECMWIGPRDRQIYFPMELLEVAYGQVRNRQLNEIQLSKMVREAATPPNIRKQKIEEVISNMKYSTNPDFKAFGLDIGNEFYPVKAKILNPPKLAVGGGRGTEIPRRGVWNANGLLKPEALSSWGFIAVECAPNSCNFGSIIDMIMNVGKQLGMQVAPPQLTRFNERTRVDELKGILEQAVRANIKFLFIVISMRGRDYYHQIKQIAECHVGILTQCVKEATASKRMNPQTVKNILLKVNSKLMGINHAIDGASMPRCLREGKVMVVGADVTHPSPEQTNIPSIAAVTASIDPKCYIYNIEMSIQTPKKETIVQFEDMMVDHFQLFKKRSGSLPHKIYVFRDGVSEGQFAEVMNCELTAIHRAYQRLSGNNQKPEILFLLVQKRHHTRFFQPGQNSQYNVEPGTVVDTHIVHARELDFYLVSHQAIKGTARPTRYHAVCNDGGIPADEVEQLAYYLCHLYSRCMRSVSYPTPTYYAHLACTRAKSLTYGSTFDNNALEKQPQRLQVLDKMLQHSRMFFV